MTKTIQDNSTHDLPVSPDKIDKDFAVQLDLTKYQPRLYYSQNREDLILSAFFPNIDDGFYVDVGAYDPNYDSVTKLFYQRGWRGINIEPQINRYKYFVTDRKRDINLNIGVSNKAGTLKLRSYENQGLSTFSNDMMREYEGSAYTGTAEYIESKIEVLTLADIFTKHGVSTIQFLKIDVEGLETQVIEGNDWKKFRPEVVCIEANHAKDEWRSTLAKHAYSEHFNDGLNAYYVDNQSHAYKSFDYVQNIVVERGGGISINDFETIRKLKQSTLTYESMLWDADAELNKKTKELATKERELTSIKLTSSRLLKLLKRKISI